MTLESRLRARLVETATGCLEWQGYRVRHGYQHDEGYGRIGNGYGTMLYTHRVAWEIASGPIPDGLQVLHRCDNPPCCNPAHLFLGTNADNNADMMAKGRKVSVRGEAHGRAKLSDRQVAEVKSLSARGWSQRRIAAAVGCSQTHVSDLVNGRVRQSVGG